MSLTEQEELELLELEKEKTVGARPELQSKEEISNEMFEPGAVDKAMGPKTPTQAIAGLGAYGLMAGAAAIPGLMGGNAVTESAPTGILNQYGREIMKDKIVGQSPGMLNKLAGAAAKYGKPALGIGAGGGIFELARRIAR